MNLSKHLYNESLFRIIYIISMFLSFVCLIEVPCQVVTYVLMAWAFVLMLNKIQTKQIKKIKYLKLLILFLLCMLLTTVINIKNNFFLNLLLVYHVAICFFIFYGLYTEANIAKVKREMLTIGHIIIQLSTLFSIIGLLIMLIEPRLTILGYHFGLMDNRYVGVYTNSNLCAFVSVISIIFCHIAFVYNLSHNKIKNKKLISKRLLLACAFINFLTLLLSDSNASLLFLLLYACTFSVIYNLKVNYKKSRKIKLLNLMWVIATCLAAILSILLMRIGVQYSVSEFMNSFHSVHYVATITGSDSMNDIISIGRSTTSYDVSSGRTDSFNKALSLYTFKPIFGVGKENIVVSGSKFLKEGFLYSDLHNGFLSILVGYGIVGFLVFAIFSILVCKHIISTLIHLVKKGKGTMLIILFSAVFSYCIFSIFEKALLLDITFMVNVFWLLLGYTMAYTKIHKNIFVDFSNLKVSKKFSKDIIHIK